MCPSTDEWIKKMGLYTMQYYCAIKKDTSDSFVGEGMDLETIVLSKTNQMHKLQCHMTFLI